MISRLTVLYDAGCAFCRGVRAWLEQEPQEVPLEFLAAGSPQALRRFPELDHAATREEITVVSDSGAVYLGERAWLICLWALHDYRGWAIRLADPKLLPTARQVVQWVAANRLRLGGPALEACADGTCAT